MNILKSKWYGIFHPVLWSLLGVGSFAMGGLLDLPTSLDWQTLVIEDSQYKTTDGRFACWWIEDAMSEERYLDNSDFVKELFQVYLKHCVELPRP